MIIDSNVYAISSSQYVDVLEQIISKSQHKSPTVTFDDYLAFTKGATYDELFYKVPETDTHNFDNYNGFSNSPAIFSFGLNYVYAPARQVIASISAFTDIVTTVCYVAALVRYCTNGISVYNIPVEVKKLKKIFLFNPDNIVMKTLEARGE